MLTEFGKVLRSIRISRHELLKDMADKLKITSAQLSSIEIGKIEVSSNLINELSKIYRLSENEIMRLREG